MPEGLGVVLLTVGFLIWWRVRSVPVGLRSRLYGRVALVFTVAGAGLVAVGMAA